MRFIHVHMEIAMLKNFIQDCHLNFLIGSGLSMPYLATVGNTEALLTALSKNESLEKWQVEIIRCSILGKFFEDVVYKNLEVAKYRSTDTSMRDVLAQYNTFLSTLNRILILRKNTLLSKQVNLFTTNVDLFLERALDEAQLEFSDGFSGRMRPIFSLTNFKKSFMKRSSHYDNVSEMPGFNLLKVHGSLSWKTEGETVVYFDQSVIEKAKTKWDAIKGRCIQFGNTDGLTHFEAEVSKLTTAPDYEAFLEMYSELAIVNPTKEKFQETILNLNHYELLRIFSNELEKENSLLIILGFSLADEHLREIILRSANSNPTLKILVYCYNDAAKAEIEANIEKGNVPVRNNNLLTIGPNSDS